MAIWFRHGSCTVGVEDGLIRAADFARFKSLLTAAGSVARERDQLIAEGEAEIERKRDDMLAQAKAELAAARQERERAYSEGFEQGLADAAAQWTERSVQCAWSKKRDLERQTERLSEIVSMAVDRIIEQEDRTLIYGTALRTVVKLLKDVPFLTLRVPDGGRDQAQAAVDAVLTSLGSELRIEVLADATLADGSCLFESDLGIIDAGIETQLAAIKRAVTRAAQLVAIEAMSDPASQEHAALRAAPGEDAQEAMQYEA
jgi:type III secretion protein L